MSSDCPNREGLGREGGHGRCCCNCRHHLPDYYHCCTVELPPTSGKSRMCVCSLQKGWICYIDDLEGARAHSNWSEHGECEMHDYTKLYLEEQAKKLAEFKAAVTTCIEGNKSDRPQKCVQTKQVNKQSNLLGALYYLAHRCYVYLAYFCR